MDQTAAQNTWKIFRYVHYSYSKKIDIQIGTPYRTGHHTTKDDSKDILTMAAYILEAMNDIPFDDPVATGMKKIQEGWLCV